ncbi:MAG: PocR ligand-binding domain-containing protein [Candidatus Firestonebacteria bacterium]
MKLRLQEQVNFSDLANSKTFEEFFSIVQELSGIKMALVSADRNKGKFLFKIEEMNPICLTIRTDPKGFLACKETDRINCARAAKNEKGIHYLCHAGLIDIAVPIFVEGNHIATINCGQVLPEKPTLKGWEAFYAQNKHLKVNFAGLKEAYLKSPFITKNRLESTVKLLSFFADYFCETGRKLKVRARASERPEILSVKKYIEQHFREPVNLAEAANYVSLSPAYLSHIFNKITGMHFIDYLQNLRIGEAKKLLKQTDWSITKISSDIGYNNLTHFNRVFKKLENVCPKDFRRSNQSAKHP